MLSNTLLLQPVPGMCLMTHTIPYLTTYVVNDASSAVITAYNNTACGAVKYQIEIGDNCRVDFDSSFVRSNRNSWLRACTLISLSAGSLVSRGASRATMFPKEYDDQSDASFSSHGLGLVFGLCASRMYASARCICVDNFWRKGRYRQTRPNKKQRDNVCGRLTLLRSCVQYKQESWNCGCPSFGQLLFCSV